MTNRRNTDFASLGLLIMRLALGITMMMHGWQKYHEWTVSGTTASFTQMGIPYPEFSAPFATYVELLGGLALILGVLTRLAGALIAVDMAGALFFTHLPNGFFASNGGYEMVLIYGALALGIALIGAGAYSVDRSVANRRG